MLGWSRGRSAVSPPVEDGGAGESEVFLELKSGCSAWAREDWRGVLNGAREGGDGGGAHWIPLLPSPAELGTGELAPARIARGLHRHSVLEA